MILALKFLVDLGCGCLFSWGGHTWHNARRYIMPVIICLSVSFLTHTWWLGLTVLPACGTLTRPYKDGKWFVRGSWLALQACVIGLGAFLTSHLSCWFYAPYIVGAFALGALLYSYSQVIGDLIFGIWIGSIVWFVY